MAFFIILSASALPCAADGLEDMQLFAPYVPTTYGGQPQPNEGLFFSFEYMMWSVSRPEVTDIGADGYSRTVWDGPSSDDTWQQGNSHSTGIFGAPFTNGQRYEIGRIYNRHGWMFSAFHLNSQSQNKFLTDLDVAFLDHEWGDAGYDHLEGEVDLAGEIIEALPVTFATAKAHNRVRTWGVELDYLVRSRQMYTGGFFELSMGARYLEFNEDFCIEAWGKRTDVTDDDGGDDGGDDGDDGDGDTTTYNIEGVLADSYWETDANNHIVGPQIGLRYFHNYNRWTFSTEGKFFAGFNSQNIHQTGLLGSELDSDSHIGLAPLVMGPTPFENNRTLHEWSPGVEFRFQADWQVTRYMTLGVGWTGLWLGGIARPSNMVDYSLGSDENEASIMGIMAEHNRQDVFINGVTFRVAFNR